MGPLNNFIELILNRRKNTLNLIILPMIYPTYNQIQLSTTHEIVDNFIIVVLNNRYYFYYSNIYK